MSLGQMIVQALQICIGEKEREYICTVASIREVIRAQRKGSESSLGTESSISPRYPRGIQAWLPIYGALRTLPTLFGPAGNDVAQKEITFMGRHI